MISFSYSVTFNLSLLVFPEGFQILFFNHLLLAIWLWWYLDAVFFKFILLLVPWVLVCGFVDLWMYFLFLSTISVFVIEDWQTNHKQVLNMPRHQSAEYSLTNSCWLRKNQFGINQENSIDVGITIFLWGVGTAGSSSASVICVLCKLLLQCLSFPIFKMRYWGVLIENPCLSIFHDLMQPFQSTLQKTCISCND